MTAVLAPVRQLTARQLPTLYRVVAALQGPHPAQEIRALLDTETDPGARSGFEAALAELTRQGRA